MSYRFLLILVSFSVAFTVPPRPVNSYVYDEPDLLTPAQEQRFNQLAEALWKKAGFGLGIAVVQDIGNEDERDVAVRTASAWGLGNAKKDEAALIFVA
ncbi:MAG TPA: TPM domain-containing protein, partial [Fibrobacteraceae bacterium]|nr:TPM domain-containing protein [Fibrobacteraceae bacterium]